MHDQYDKTTKKNGHQKKIILMCVILSQSGCVNYAQRYPKKQIAMFPVQNEFF